MKKYAMGRVWDVEDEQPDKKVIEELVKKDKGNYLQDVSYLRFIHRNCICFKERAI